MLCFCEGRSIFSCYATFCENWVLQLDKDDKVSLTLFLSKHDISETQAVEMAGLMVGKSDRAIRECESYFFPHDSSIPESKRRNMRSEIIWGNEQLNAKEKVHKT